MPPFDLQKLLEMAPLVVGAMKPGSPEAAAMMRGFMRSQQQMQQQGMLEQDRERRVKLDEQQAANLTADNARADESFNLQKQTAELNRVRAFREDASKRANQLMGGADLGASPTDPSLQNQIATDALKLSQAYGVPPSAASTVLPNTTAVMSARLKKHANELIEKYDKTHGDNAVAMEGSLSPNFGPFAGKSFQEIRALAQQEVPPAPPSAKPGSEGASDLDRSYQREKKARQAKLGRLLTPEEDAALDREIRREVRSINQPQTPSGLPPRVLTRVDSVARGFDSQPIVRTTQKMAEAVSFADSMDPNTKNPADDQALIYAFAKAMDPESVVREGEYATVQKYAQAWAETYGFNVARVFSNTQFLTAQARQNMKSTIQKKYRVAKSQYDNVRQSYVNKINKITNQQDGEDYLIDYGGGFPEKAGGDDQFEILSVK